MITLGETLFSSFVEYAEDTDQTAFESQRNAQQRVNDAVSLPYGGSKTIVCCNVVDDERRLVLDDPTDDLITQSKGISLHVRLDFANHRAQSGGFILAAQHENGRLLDTKVFDALPDHQIDDRVQRRGRGYRRGDLIENRQLLDSSPQSGVFRFESVQPGLKIVGCCQVSVSSSVCGSCKWETSGPV